MPKDNKKSPKKATDLFEKIIKSSVKETPKPKKKSKKKKDN